jgi:hypothetical protein
MCLFKSILNFIINQIKIYIFVWTYTTLLINHLEIIDINYVKAYENAFDVRKDILNENKGKSEIYMLNNKLIKD